MKVKSVFLGSLLMMVASFASAENAAPVYDVDNYSSDSFSENGQGQQQSAVETQAYSSSPSSSFEQQPQQPAASSSSSSSVQQRVARLEQQGPSTRVNELQSEVQSLRGQVEELTHQLQQLQHQQRTQFSDLDKRLSSTTVAKTEHAGGEQAPQSSSKTPKNQETAKPAPKQMASNKSATNSTDVQESLLADEASLSTEETNDQPNVAEEQQIYQTAYNYIKEKKYSQAITALQNMLQKYPTGQFAANAHYWLGELYGLMNKNEQAASEFLTVTRDYADSPRVSDAQLKLGLIYAAQFKWSDAKTAFKKVVSLYPDSASSRVALEQLKQIKEAGH